MSGDRYWFPPGGQPPPLPPRSPRPSEPVSYSPAYYAQYGSLPPPPPGPPPRSPGPSPSRSEEPPPIPPRPPGFETAGTNSHMYGEPASAAPVTVSLAHNETSSAPLMSANQPWLSQQPAPTTYIQSGPLPHTQLGSAQLIPTSATIPTQPRPQPQIVLSEVTDNLCNLQVSGRPPSPPSSTQQGACDSYSLPAPPSMPPSATYNSSPSPIATSPLPKYGTPSEAGNYQTPSYAPPQSQVDLHSGVSQVDIAPSASVTAYQAYAPSEAPARQDLSPPLTSSYRNDDFQAYMPYSPGAIIDQHQIAPGSQLQPSSTVNTNQMQQPGPSSAMPQHDIPNQSQLIASPATSQPPVEPPSHGQYAVSDITSAKSPHKGSSEAKPQAATACIDTMATFATTWYTHPAALEFYICSRCYVDHIHPTRFQHMFAGRFLEDRKPRRCHFSTPRMSRHLFPAAVSSGSLQDVLNWMNRRSAIVDCKGVQGAKASEGIKWFTAKNGDIDGFLACEACYEDVCSTNDFACHLQPMTEVQSADNLRACNMAIPFIKRAYTEFGKSNAWTTLSEEAAIRLHSVPACSGVDAVSTNGRKWYRPKDNDFEGFVICVACYCDHVLLTPDVDKWQDAPELTRQLGTKATCDLAQLSALSAMLIAQEREDYAVFWTAIREINRHPRCESKGTAGAVWYTLPSHPPEFGICGACHAGLLRPLRVDKYFVRNNNIPSDAILLCCYNHAHPRRNGMVQKLLEMYFLQDPQALETYAVDFAGTPPCKRDEDFKNGTWYGWDNCTICPECYVEFVKGTALASKMPLQGVSKGDSQLCEMYSPRMRNLYLEACEKGDTSELLEFSAHRRSVYYQTIPECRMMLFQAKMKQTQQMMNNVSGTFYTNLGAMQQITMPSAYVYSSPGLGGGYHNQNQIQGAAYSKAGWDAFTDGQALMTNAKFRVQELEKRWRAVE